MCCVLLLLQAFDMTNFKDELLTGQEVIRAQM